MEAGLAPASEPEATGDAPVRDVSSAEAYTRFAGDLLAREVADSKVKVVEPLVLEVESSAARQRVNLHRIWRYCAQDPARCEGATREFVRRTAEVLVASAEPGGALPPIAPAQLRAAIRPLAEVDEVRRLNPGIIAEPLTEDLWIVYMIDAPRSTMLLDERGLHALGLDDPGARRTARQNTREDVGELARHTRELPPGTIGTINTGNYYVSSLILEHDAWGRVRQRLKGDLLVAVPARDLLVYADSASPDIDKVLGAIVERLMNASQVPLSKTVLRWTTSGWERWRP